MRSCEHSVTPTPGRTRLLTLKNIMFRSKRKVEVPHSSRTLHRSQHVTIIFADQKNGRKFDMRTQQRTGDPALCPVRRWASATQRILRLSPGTNTDTPVCAYPMQPKTLHVTNNFLLKLIRSVCKICGGKSTFGFNPSEIGNRSIRSGAAMALFLADHSPARIMTLGRWSSDAFLVHIRPQVLEWTNNMSYDMTNYESFLDLSSKPSHRNTSNSFPSAIIRSEEHV